MSGFQQGLRVCILFALIGVLVFALFAVLGPPLGHSYVLNFTWSVAFAEQLFAGDVYPRWLFGANMGAGSPSFFFYGPLPFWVNALSGGLLCPSCDTERWLMVGPSVLLALSGIAFYAWARLYSRALIAVLAAGLYVVLPYHFAIDLWYRFALGEFAVYVWMPIILLGLARAPDAVRYALLAAFGYAGLLYTHLPGALLFSPLLVLYVASRFGVVSGVRALVMPVVLGLGLAALYIVPALSTQAFINPVVWWEQGSHFDPLNWLWLDGRDAPAFAGVVLPTVLAPTVLSALMIAHLWLTKAPTRTTAIFCALGLLYAWFLMTGPSTPLWEHIGLLRKVQFPWRVGIVVDLCAATVFALWLEANWARPRRLAAMGGVVALALASYYVLSAPYLRATTVAGTDPAIVEAVREDTGRARDGLEYRPVWSMRSNAAPDFDALAERLETVPEVAIVTGDGAVTVRARDVDRLELTVEAQTPVRVRLRRFYYPGWRLVDAAGEALALEPSDQLGLIEAQLTDGSHQLILERHALKEEWIGGLVSFLALVLSVGWWARARHTMNG